MNAVGWAIVLRGREDDLLDWEHALRKPFSPWVERYVDLQGTEHFLLRSFDFEALETPSSLQDVAVPLMMRLNGILKATEQTEPVAIGTGLRFRADGLVDKILFARSATFNVKFGKVRLRATVAIGGPFAPPRPTAAQRWTALSYSSSAADRARADRIADLLDHLGRATDWYNVYKTYELAYLLCGGERTLLTHPFAKAERAEVLKQNANFHRHAPGRFDQPKRVMALDEAIERVRRIAIGVLGMIDSGRDPRMPSQG